MLTEVVKVELHHVCICIDLSQGKVGIASGVKGKNQGDPRVNSVCGHRVGASMLTPFSPMEGSVVEPGLIYVKDPLPLLQQVQHDHGELLPEYQVPLGVAMERDCLDLTVLQMEVAAEDLLNEGVRHLQSILGHHCMFDYRRLENVLLGPELL